MAFHNRSAGLQTPVLPSLGGSIEPDTSWCTSGIFYGNGRAYSSIREEAKQKMLELMEQRNQFFLSNGINPEYYKGMPKEYDSQRTEIEYRFKCFADLRASARSGNTAPLYQRCLQHIQKAAGKQLQDNQLKQLENAVAQQEAQAQAGMINI